MLNLYNLHEHETRDTDQKFEGIYTLTFGFNNSNLRRFHDIQVSSSKDRCILKYVLFCLLSSYVLPSTLVNLATSKAVSASETAQYVRSSLLLQCDCPL